MYGWGGDGCGKKGGEEAQAGHQNGLGSDEVDGLQRWGDVPPTAVEANQKYFVSEEAIGKKPVSAEAGTLSEGSPRDGADARRTMRRTRRQARNAFVDQKKCLQ